MNENEMNNQIEQGAQTNTDNGAQQYIDAIREMQKNSVSRDKYTKLEQENKQLLDTLVNGGTVEQVNVEPELTTMDLRKKIANADKDKLNSYEFIKTSLELRDKVMAETGDDIFAKDSSYEAISKAERTAQIYQQCIDACNGNPQEFVKIFENCLTESPMANMKNTNNKRRF